MSEGERWGVYGFLIGCCYASVLATLLTRQPWAVLGSACSVAATFIALSSGDKGERE